MRISDWSSDVCSSDLRVGAVVERELIGLAVETELSARDPVRIAADGHREIIGLVDIARKVVIAEQHVGALAVAVGRGQRLQRSEEHTSELQSLMRISYAVFCLNKKKINEKDT